MIITCVTKLDVHLNVWDVDSSIMGPRAVQIPPPPAVRFWRCDVLFVFPHKESSSVGGRSENQRNFHVNIRRVNIECREEGLPLSHAETHQYSFERGISASIILLLKCRALAFSTDRLTDLFPVPVVMTDVSDAAAVSEWMSWDVVLGPLWCLNMWFIFGSYNNNLKPF